MLYWMQDTGVSPIKSLTSLLPYDINDVNESLMQQCFRSVYFQENVNIHPSIAVIVTSDESWAQCNCHHDAVDSA